MEIDLIETGPHPKDLLLLPLFAFAEKIQTLQQDHSQEDLKRRQLGVFVANLCHTGKFINFAQLFHEALPEGQVPTPYQALKTLLEDDRPLHTRSALYASTQRKLQTELLAQDLRIYQDDTSESSIALYTLSLGKGFLGYESMLQLAVTSRGTLQLALSSGIKPALEVNGAAFMDSNSRILARTFPSSIMLEYAPPSVSLSRSRVLSVYTWSGSSRESHTELF